MTAADDLEYDDLRAVVRWADRVVFKGWGGDDIHCTGDALRELLTSSGRDSVVIEVRLIELPRGGVMTDRYTVSVDGRLLRRANYGARAIAMELARDLAELWDEATIVATTPGMRDVYEWRSGVWLEGRERR